MEWRTCSMYTGATPTDKSRLCRLPVGCCVQTHGSLVRRQVTFRHPKFSFISHLGRMIFSLGSSEAKSLKVLNLTEGGWRKGLAPKLNSHCWYDIKLAAAKKPDLTTHRGERKKEVHFRIDGGTEGRVCVYLRGWREDLFLWRQLMSIQIEDHLLLAEVQQEADGISWTTHTCSRVKSWHASIVMIHQCGK